MAADVLLSNVVKMVRLDGMVKMVGGEHTF